jgi:hypothetical protein
MPRIIDTGGALASNAFLSWRGWKVCQMAKADESSMSETRIAEVASTLPPAIFRDADYLVVRQRWVELPAGCVICGALESGRLSLKIRKASKLCALLGLFGAFVYFAAPAACLHAGFCAEHRSRGRGARIVIRILLGTALLLLVTPIWFADPMAILFGYAHAFLLVNLAIIYEIVRRKPLKAVRADRHFVWLAGVSPATLSQFEEVDDQADGAPE